MQETNKKPITKSIKKVDQGKGGWWGKGGWIIF